MSATVTKRVPDEEYENIESVKAEILAAANDVHLTHMAVENAEGLEAHAQICILQRIRAVETTLFDVLEYWPEA